MSFACAGAVGRTETDHRLAVDECRLVRFLSLFNGFGNCFDIVAVDRADDVPVIGFETFANVFAEPVFDLAVDGNTVVIVQSDEFVEFPNTGQRADFVRNAFHQAAVT